MQSAVGKRNLSLDIVRIVAVLAVVMVHVSAYFVTRYGCGTFEFTLGNIFDAVSRLGVPLFLMVSGALFLDQNKKIATKTILYKNALGLAVITVIWAVIYSLVDNFVLNSFHDIKSVFDLIVYGYYHMWYLYMIIGIYIITPFLRAFVRVENKRLVLFFIAVCLLVQFVLPLVNKALLKYADVDYVGALTDKLKLSFFGEYLTYYVLGWYLTHVGIKKKWLRIFAYFLGAAALAFIILYVHFGGSYLDAYNNIGIPVFVYATSAFLALTNIKISAKEKTAKTLATMSKLTFGVYIIHAMVLEFFFKWFPYKSGALLYLLVCYAVTLTVSLALTFVISKIPTIKKLVRG